MRILAFMVVALALALLGCAQPSPDALATAPDAGASTALPSGAPMEALRARLSPESLPPSQISGEGYSQLQAFYAVRNYAPIWVDVAGVGAKGRVLLARLRLIAPENPLEVAPLLAEAEKRIGASDQPALAELELLLSAAFAAAAIYPNNPAARSSPHDALFNLAASADVIAVLRDQLPIDPAFWRLRSAIWTYRELAARGGWATLPEGPKLELGIRDPAVAGLRQRLLATGDLAEPGTDPEGFDAGLEAALRRFQARHGLEVDGVVGKDTRAALDVPVEARLATLEFNLRRLHQQHREWGQRYVAVNAAAATYRLVDGGRPIFERVAIVGRHDWPTPQLDSTIDRLEFNPYWVVPLRIARLEVLPKVRRDPNYMRDNDMHWVGGQIRQNPGRLNPLGKVKFLFPNPYDVYLHDTNSPRLFQRADRFLSHGCMRISEALEMAAYLLRNDPQWPPERVEHVLQAGRAVQFRLIEPIPIHVVYDTAWVDESGIVNFRDDAYGQDRFGQLNTANAAGDGRS